MMPEVSIYYLMAIFRVFLLIIGQKQNFSVIASTKNGIDMKCHDSLKPLCEFRVGVMSGSCQVRVRVVSGSCQGHVGVISGLFQVMLGSCQGYDRVFSIRDYQFCQVYLSS